MLLLCVDERVEHPGFPSCCLNKTAHSCSFVRESNPEDKQTNLYGSCCFSVDEGLFSANCLPAPSLCLSRKDCRARLFPRNTLHHIHTDVIHIYSCVLSCKTTVSTSRNWRNKAFLMLRFRIQRLLGHMHIS